MNYLSMRFGVSKGSVFDADSENSCEIKFDGQLLTVSVWYDFKEEPLMLVSKAHVGDNAELIVRSYRLELYLNGELVDEEWPCGMHYLTAESRFTGDISLIMKEITENFSESKPDVIRSGIAVSEIRHPGVNIGDCMPYSDETDGRYHLFYLYDRHHHKSRWGLGAHQWAHISTKDFLIWNEHPIAIGLTNEWEGSICTGSVCRADDRWYAWYAVRMPDHSPARITYAVSEDLIHFEKCGEYFSLPECYDTTRARDPMVFFLDGQFHMFVTTGRASDGHGCIVHLVNDRMAVDGWHDKGIVLVWSEICTVELDEAGCREQPECPDFFKIGEYYYLVFGIGGTSHYVYSKNPFGDWVLPPYNCVPCGSVPKSALLPGTGRRIFMGFIPEGGYGGRLCAAEAFVDPDGTLRFEELTL